MLSCKSPRPNLDVDVQGHRGCRGLMPENTIPAFLHALELGVTTLELDLIMNEEGQLVVSHEPWMNPEICFGPNGQEIVGQPNLYKMSQSKIEQYDCGSRPNKDFQSQRKIKTYKPLLRDVVETVKDVAGDQISLITWNIEIKYRPDWENVFCPPRAEYLARFYDEIDALGIADATILQCFDAEVLRMANELNRNDVKLSYLIYNFNGIRKNIRKLGFRPDYYSPHYRFVTGKALRRAEDMGIKLAVWTVNEEREMERLLNLGVHAIITDYPNRLKEVLSKLRGNKP